MSEHEREPETEYNREPGVVEQGEDPFGANAPPVDPYTPEPGPRPGEGRAFRVMLLALIPIGITVLIVVIAAVR